MMIPCVFRERLMEKGKNVAHRYLHKVPHVEPRHRFTSVALVNAVRNIRQFSFTSRSRIRKLSARTLQASFDSRSLLLRLSSTPRHMTHPAARSLPVFPSPQARRQLHSRAVIIRYGSLRQRLAQNPLFFCLQGHGQREVATLSSLSFFAPSPF